MGIGIEFHHTDTPEWAKYLLWFQAVTVNQLGIIMASQEANAAAIEAVVTQLGKAKTEILGKIAAVQAAVDAGQDLTAPLADLTGVAQALDDIVPDAPAAPVDAPDAPVDAPDAPADAPVDAPVDPAPVAPVDPDAQVIA